MYIAFVKDFDPHLLSKPTDTFHSLPENKNHFNEVHFTELDTVDI